MREGDSIGCDGSDGLEIDYRTIGSGLLSPTNWWQKRGSDIRQPGFEPCPARLGQEVDVYEPLSDPSPLSLLLPPGAQP